MLSGPLTLPSMSGIGVYVTQAVRHETGISHVISFSYLRPTGMTKGLKVYTE